jgi:hypothetical protein
LSLNINYQGNITNANGDEVECKYQAYVPSIDKWSDIRESEDFQYNINFGDGDLKTQSGTVSSGEIILIAFWIGAETRDVELEQFSVIQFSYDGTDSTVQDVQILPPHMPSCSFSLPDNGYVGVEVSASSSASIVYQWSINGYTHFQRQTWYGTTVFGFLSIIDDKFLFDTNYTDDTSFTYTNSGDYLVRHRAITSYNLQSICEKNVRIKYSAPIPHISFSPDSVVVGDAIGVTDTVTDEYSRITNIEHIFDGILIAENTESTFSYIRQLLIYKEYVARMSISWNDGFDDQTLSITASPSVNNQPPIISLIVNKENSGVKGLYKASITTSDNEGDVVNVNWKIFFLNTGSNLPDPYFICNSDKEGDTFENIYNRDMEPSVTELDLLFAIKGQYKITVTAYDEQGLNAASSQTIEVTEVCTTGTGTGTSTEDCEVLIAAAIEAYEREHQLRLVELKMEELSQCKLAVVRDNLSENTGVGTVYGEFEIKDITGSTGGVIDGEPVVGTGSSSNSIVGN